MSSFSSLKGTVVQIASYNTNLQGDFGVPQDLVDWLSPTLTVSNFLSRAPSAPDIVAVGFQELLPLHLGFCGLSKSVIKNRDALIRSQIEAHAPNKESYSLVAHEVFVGVAILVYARDSGIGRRVCDVQTSWTGCGPAWMGNKGLSESDLELKRWTAALARCSLLLTHTLPLMPITYVNG